MMGAPGGASACDDDTATWATPLPYLLLLAILLAILLLLQHCNKHLAAVQRCGAPMTTIAATLTGGNTCRTTHR